MILYLVAGVLVVGWLVLAGMLFWLERRHRRLQALADDFEQRAGER